MKTLKKNSSFSPGTIWITGLSASGKTTLGKRLRTDLLSSGVEVVLLDGEEVRARIQNFGYSLEERNKVAFKIAELALEYNKSGKMVIVNAITHQRETRAKIREYLGRYMEVYLRCPVEVCAARDYKGNYQRALAGELDNFIGITFPYEESTPELVLDTHRKSVEECSAILLAHALKFKDGHMSDE